MLQKSWQDTQERPEPNDHDEDAEIEAGEGAEPRDQEGEAEENLVPFVDGPSSPAVDGAVAEAADAGSEAVETQPGEVDFEPVVGTSDSVHARGSDADGDAAMTSSKGLNRGSSCLDLVGNLTETQPDPVLEDDLDESGYDKYTVEDKKVDLPRPVQAKGFEELPDSSDQDLDLQIKMLEIKLRELALLHRQLTLDTL